MVEQPTVCAIMLTRDRPELAAKAVECFRAQTYENKALLIWNTGPIPDKYPEYGDPGILTHFAGLGEQRLTIGALRNIANEYACTVGRPQFDILIHWDDDDHSHPNRIAEQVALLQASGADVVGYNQMLFARSFPGPQGVPCPSGDPHLVFVRGNGSIVAHVGASGRGCPANDKLYIEAWLYSHPLAKPTLGTSLCYWRKTWERKPFNPKLPVNSESMGEDWDFIRGLNVHAVSSLYIGDELTGTADDGIAEPRMIARIHGSNTVKYNLDESNGDTWKRVPEWDSRVRGILG